MTRSSNRPSTHDDLDEYQKQGHCIFNWYSDLGKYPAVEQHIVKAKLEAQRLGFQVTHSEIRVPLTTEELDAKLVDIQERYDKGLVLYTELVAGSRYYSDFTYTEKNQADYCAEREGLVPADKVEKISAANLELELED